MKRFPRFAVPISALALMLSAILIPAGPAAAQIRAHATTAHPYSNPVWFPVANATVMNCMWDNPGCPPSQVQPYWGWDIAGLREPAGQFHQKVYAMGAGVVHVLAQHQGCGGSNEQRGNVLYVDHGAGVISMYSHLAGHFLVQDGDYVSARTPIGYLGNSGYKLCKEKPEVRFLAVVVKHDARRAPNGGMTGTYMQVTHTYACVQGQRVDWPQQLPGHSGLGWSRWHSVPLGVPIPATSSLRGCIPAPATATKPRDTALRHYGQTGLTGHWTQAPGRYNVTSVRATLQEYHPSIHKWMDLSVHVLAPTATSTTFHHLHTYHEFRLRLWFGNHVGWSHATPWLQRGFPN